MTPPLSIITDKTTSSNPYPSTTSLYANKRKQRRQTTCAELDRLWLLFPDHENPNRNCLQQQRIERTVELIQQYGKIDGQQIVDLGCGEGTLTRRLNDLGSQVTGVDASQKALGYVNAKGMVNISTFVDVLPDTKLPDSMYDGVLCTDVIAELDPRDYRLFFSELARLVKPNGWIICSTPIDIYSDGAIERFSTLAETELNIVGWTMSYHRLQLHLSNFFKGPSRRYKGIYDLDYRQYCLRDRSKTENKWWGKYGRLWGPFWGSLAFLFSPIVAWINSSQTLLLVLEKLSRILWHQRAITHALFIARRRNR